MSDITILLSDNYKPKNQINVKLFQNIITLKSDVSVKQTYGVV